VNFENQIADDDVNRAYSKFETSFIEMDDFGPPAVLSKKYVFMEFFFNFVTRFLCFL
jgi:hypothetical protein